MIDSSTETELVVACEQRLGQVVHAASIIHIRRISSPVGRSNPRKPAPMAVALTESDVWFLELRQSIVGLTVGGARCRLPRGGLAAHWRHRRWAWPNVWKAELSWPELATYVEGALMTGADTDRIIGLVTSDELHRELRVAARSGCADQRPTC